MSCNLDRMPGNIKKRGSSKVRPVAMPLKPLKQSQRMDTAERIFLEAVERGDKHTVIRCLQGNNSVNINCTNMLGRSAIQIAVDNENVEIVEILLQQEGVKIGDALLYAIREGVYKIVEMIIDHPSISLEMLGSGWSRADVGGEESSDYSRDISPIMLAAHCNQFEILQLLILRGADIKRPHELSCSCKVCQEHVLEDSLRHSLYRINSYRALASPAWISLTSYDPILTAFKLSWELHKLALRENEFKETYLHLRDQCRKYACDLLEQCRTSEEVIAVLNKENESDDDSIDNKSYGILNANLTLSRLKLALKYEQKQFVAHPHCQQLLTSIWYEGLPGWRKRNGPTKFFMCIGLILLVPFMAVYYLIFPRSKIGQILRSPFMKFLYHSASFGVFLCLLAFASMDMSSDSQREQYRGPAPSHLEWLIVFWVMGFVWAECKQLWEEGLKAYITQWWNWLDFIMLSLYLTTFSLRLVAYILIESGEYGPRTMLRKDWPPLDPTLVSESFFAVANVFSFSRIIYLFQANQHLGPMQISLGCMLIDIAKFLFIFFLVLTSFACGLNQLYWYYNASREKDDPDSFYTLGEAYITLYWSLFGLIALKDLRLSNGQQITESVGMLLFMFYHCMAIVVIINMLIAMMSNSYQIIENHADMEWKFSRSKLWMGYFDEGSTLPTPFNIIISPKSIYYFLRKIKSWLCYCFYFSRFHRQKHKRQSTAKVPKNKTTTSVDDISIFTTGPVINYKEQPRFSTRSMNGHLCTSPPSYDKLHYQSVMKRLVSRYIHQTKKQRQQDGVNEDDLLEIKQDISSLRYELREDRKKEAQKAASYFDAMKSDILAVVRGMKNSTDQNSVICSSSSMPSPGGYGMAKSQPVRNPIDMERSTVCSGPPFKRPNDRSDITADDFMERACHPMFDMARLKKELVESVRTELRSCLEDYNLGNKTFRSTMLPSVDAELYQTHLYTQL